MSNLTDVVCRKVGMTRLFRKDGTIQAATVLCGATNFVVQPAYYNRSKAAEVMFVNNKLKARTRKPQLCHFIKHNCPPSSVLRESHLRSYEPTGTETPREVNLSNILCPGLKVCIRGKSIGKGFAGVIKRHGFKSGKASHGNSKAHNKLGSVGMTQDPGRVFPGKRMAGQMGNARVSISGVEVVFLDLPKGLIVVKGTVPGPAGSLLSVNLGKTN